jgi:hypothetical protein
MSVVFCSLRSEVVPMQPYETLSKDIVLLRHFAL